MSIMKEFHKDQLLVKIFEDRQQMGKNVAKMIGDKICELQDEKEIRIIFAAAPSQNEFLENIIQDSRIRWENITAFHMDEYIGLPNNAPQKFSNFLKEKIFDKVNFKQVHLISSDTKVDEELKRYSTLLEEAPIDIVCLGVGENGHIAFNDPPVADFNDIHTVKVVELETACRVQQVNDGCFKTLDEVPTKALTLTIPVLMGGEFLFAIVPGPTKTNAITSMIQGEIALSCPASILRTHKNCILFLDQDSGQEL